MDSLSTGDPAGAVGAAGAVGSAGAVTLVGFRGMVSLASSIGTVNASVFVGRVVVNLPRVPEPDFLSPAAEAAEYAAMNHAAVNERFVDDLLQRPLGDRVIDLGCGPAEIPIVLCRRLPGVQVMAIDGEVEMLELAKREVDLAGLLDRISLVHADVRHMDPFEDGMADAVISNSLMHHLDDPRQGLATAHRLVVAGGRLFVRDLARPDSMEKVESLVETYCGQETENARQLFRQSLHAALRLDEVRQMAEGLGIDPACVQMTSDRHWTLDWPALDA